MHRRQHKPYIFIVLAIIAVVAAMTWMDMRDTQNAQLRTLRFMQGASTTAELEALPESNQPLMIYAGDLKSDPDSGDTGFQPADIAPMTIAQREINLTIKADSLPEGFAPMIDAVTAVVEDWKNKNNILTEVTLDWQMENPNLDALPVFATALRKQLKMEYWTGMTLRRSWFNDTAGAALQLAEKTRDVKSYIYDLSEASRDGETLTDTIAALNKLGAPFMVRMDNPPTDRDTLLDLIKDNDMFSGFVSNTPLPKP